MITVTNHLLYIFNPLGTESIAFLGALWAECAQSILRKAVDLGYLFPDSVFYNLHSSCSFVEELVVYVKRELQRRGFHSREFASLPNDMTSGSRELLLGLGWLLCKENIITRFMKSSTSSLDDDTYALFGVSEK